MCGSTCFGCLSAHRQECTTALGAFGFTIGAWRLERCLLWSVDHDQQSSNCHAPTVKPEERTAVDHDQECSNRHAPTVKPEAPSAVVRS
jgi:hypothetical protein